MPISAPRLPRSQTGLSAIGYLFVFGLIAFFVLLVIKCLPLYLNQMKLARALKGVSDDPALSASDAQNIRDHLHRRWIIESIDTVTPEDIKIRRNEAGRAMVYDYEARTHLFYNIDLIVHFQDDVALRLPTSE